jgi:hypothetical protein
MQREICVPVGVEIKFGHIVKLTEFFFKWCPSGEAGIVVKGIRYKV